MPRYAIADAAKYLGIGAHKFKSTFKDSANPPFSFDDLLVLHIVLGIRLPVRKLLSAPEFHQEILSSLHRNGIQDLSIHSGNHRLTTRDIFPEYLKRIKSAGTDHYHFYPFIPHFDDDDPRSVMLDARINFGAPVVANTGISTRIIRARFLAGDAIPALAEEYRCDQGTLENVIRWEIRGSHPIKN